MYSGYFDILVMLIFISIKSLLWDLFLEFRRHIKYIIDFLLMQLYTNEDNILKNATPLNKRSDCSITSKSSLDSVFCYVSDRQNVIVVGNDSNANLRAFYMALLKEIHEKKDPDISFRKLKLLKKLLYNKQTCFNSIKNIPDIKTGRTSKEKFARNFLISELPQNKNPKLTTAQIKKLIAEFLHYLNQGATTHARFEQIFSRYPFMHVLLAVLMKTLLYVYCGVEQARNYETFLSNNEVFEKLGKLFKLPVQYKTLQRKTSQKKFIFNNENQETFAFKISCLKSFIGEQIFIIGFPVLTNSQNNQEQINSPTKIQSITQIPSPEITKVKVCESIACSSDEDQEIDDLQPLNYHKLKGDRRFTQQTIDSWNISERIRD